jgi:hypothetical protein
MSDPLWQDEPMKNRNRSGSKPQLDLTLAIDPGTSTGRSRRPRKPCSRERAAWWFSQMYRAIEAG